VGLLSKSSFLASTLGVTNFIRFITKYFATLCCAAIVRFKCSTNPPQFVKEKKREPLLKWKAQNSLPPCSDLLLLIKQTLFTFFTKQVTLMRSLAVLSPPFQLALPAKAHA
jgi:hypothetical protein